ncbi:MAG: murein biosynthesis integral membrane protein MurJ [Bdellovibrionia bacterium]
MAETLTPSTPPSSHLQSPAKSEKKSQGAYFVALGILFSRISGLLRESVFAHYFGNSDAGDAFKAALKIPNFLQNLFGEGILSASFIPVYSGLLARGEEENARKVAGAIASLLALMTSLLVLLGVFATPAMIDLIAPGFHGEKRELTIRLVQIFFPGVGLLVMSAWCLGILNSHRRFFLSYAAPVIQNAAIVGVMVAMAYRSSANGTSLLSGEGQSALAIQAAWGLVLGSALQFAIQLPTALKLLGGLKLHLQTKLPAVREVIRNFFPVVTARGVVQISAYIDNLLASLLPTGAVSALAYAQLLYLLPVALFGMSVSAAELPAMSSAVGTTEQIHAILRGKLDTGLKRIAFFIVPSMAAFLILGDVIVAALFQSGAFTRTNTVYVWGVLAGSTVGLLAATLGRLYSSTFYALHDTRTPLKFAVVRVFLTTGLGYLFAFSLPKALGLEVSWGTAGLTSSAGIAGWVEFMLLRRSLNSKIGKTGLNSAYVIRLWASALLAAALAWAVKVLIFSAYSHLHPKIAAVLILAPYGVAYFLVSSFVFQLEESKAVMMKIVAKVPGLRSWSERRSH